MKKINFIMFCFFLMISGCQEARENLSYEYKSNIRYKFYSDGSCKSNSTEVCINHIQAEQLCRNIDGYTEYLIKAITSVNDGRVKILFEAGSIGPFLHNWDGGQCKSELSTSGFYNGSSAKASIKGSVIVFKIEKNRVLADYIDGFAN